MNCPISFSEEEVLIGLEPLLEQSLGQLVEAVHLLEELEVLLHVLDLDVSKL
jgi:hypothetical protein